MNDKRRHAVEGIELPDFEKRFTGLHLPEKGAGLPRSSFQQVIDFPVHVDPGSRSRQHDESDQFVPGRQGHDQPGVGDFDEPRGKVEAIIATWQRTVLLKIDHPAAIEQEVAQRAAVIFGRRRNWRVPASGLREEAPRRILQPQRTTRALDHVGQPAHHVLSHGGEATLRGERLREAQPFLAIVVAVAEEMLANLHPQTRSHGT